jgi:thymidylate synthase
MNKLDLDYQNLLKDILENGTKKETRNGGTISVFGRQIRHKMSEGFPLLTTKKMAWKTMVTELLWFLRGDTNIKFLVDNNCHIWDGDAYKNYLNVVMYEKPDYLHEKHGHLKMSVKKEDDNYLPLTQEEFINRIKTDVKFRHWGELGPIYGKQWRGWTKKKMWLSTDGSYENIYDEADQTVIDQIAGLINDLKTNPDSRRLMVNAWNVGELDQMVLPPCHYGFQVYTRELSDEERLSWMKQNRPKTVLPMRDPSVEFSMDEFFRPYGVPKRAISLMWNQRSVDTFLGLPFNIASYGLLLEIIAKSVNMVPDELIGNLGDVHLYSNHIEQAKEQIGRPYTPEERHELLKTTMGDFYQTAVDEQVPFGGGLSEYYESHKIPYHSREPFELPTLKLPKTNAFWDGFDVSLFGHLDSTDFQIENYQSHPSIKAPLSN